MLTTNPATLPPATNAEPDVDLRNFLRAVGRFKWVGLGAMTAALLVAIFYLHNAQYRYTAELIVTPADQQNSGGQVPGGLASLGSIVGVDLSGQAGAAFSLFPQAITSYPVAERLSSDPRIMHAAFSPSWDAATATWREPRTTFTPIMETAKALLGVPLRPWAKPDARDLRTYINDRVIVAEDKKKTLVTLSFSHQDPEFAAYLVRRVSEAADNYLRRKALQRASTYVEYLERRLSQVQVAEYRESLSRSLSNYENVRMMASADASFAADPFGEVWVSPKPTDPNPVLVLTMAITFGLVVWLGAATASSLLGASRARAANAEHADEL